MVGALCSLAVILAHSGLNAGDNGRLTGDKLWQTETQKNLRY